MTLRHDPMLWVPLTYVCRVGNYVTRSKSKDFKVTRFGSRISARACVRVPGLAAQSFYFMTTWHHLINTEHGALHEVVHRLHQGVIYCQNVIRFNHTLQCNFTQAHTKITAFPQPIFMKLVHS